ncbi:MAG: hypothetical protein IJP34_06080 [Clostridia bacterium]|nr:hypothetical protein [Clostridia bacterium]
MFSFLKKNKNPNVNVLKQMDGREIKYVTRRTREADGTVKEIILGKEGRIVVIENEIRVMCGAVDVFRSDVENSTYYMLLSGDGITVSGVNKIDNNEMDIIVYYKYHRK